jgi:hypothetical protein
MCDDVFDVGIYASLCQCIFAQCVFLNSLSNCGQTNTRSQNVLSPLSSLLVPSSSLLYDNHVLSVSTHLFLYLAILHVFLFFVVAVRVHMRTSLLCMHARMWAWMNNLYFFFSLTVGKCFSALLWDGLRCFCYLNLSQRPASGEDLIVVAAPMFLRKTDALSHIIVWLVNSQLFSALKLLKWAQMEYILRNTVQTMVRFKCGVA